MNSNGRVKKEVKSVTVDDTCFECIPSDKHRITINYRDGTKKEKNGKPKDIIKKYGEHIDRNSIFDKDCFAAFFNRAQKSNQKAINKNNDGFLSKLTRGFRK